MVKEKVSIELDSANARVHDSDNNNAIKKSLEELGTGRSIVMDSENVVIAGNGVYQQAQELGLPVKVIQSTGKELIVIQRTDLTTDSEKRKALAIADNKTSDLSFFDDDALADLISGIDDVDILASTGFSQKELDEILANAGNTDIDDGVSGNDAGESETPADTQGVIGPYRFPIDRECYEKWIEDIRQEVGFDNESIIGEIKRRLGL